MKKLTILILAFSLGLSGFAQKKSGTVYSEHKYIDVTKDFWKAWTGLDKEGLKSILADTIYNFNNGVQSKLSKEQFANNLNYWAQFEDLEVKDNLPANPDAIEYNGDVTWVQDWLIVNGTHNASGINLEMPFHMLYRFNKEGKIFVLMWNYNNDVFEEINSSSLTRERGIVYDRHPYINTVRKIVNAHASKDIEKWKSYLAPNAYFSNILTEPGITTSIENQVTKLKKLFASYDTIKYTQIGPMNCLYYNEDGLYRVYSWWTVKMVEKSGKTIDLPIQMIHFFNNDGKITSIRSFYSSNHFE